MSLYLLGGMFIGGIIGFIFGARIEVDEIQKLMKELKVKDKKIRELRKHGNNNPTRMSKLRE